MKVMIAVKVSKMKPKQGFYSCNIYFILNIMCSIVLLYRIIKEHSLNIHTATGRRNHSKVLTTD